MNDNTTKRVRLESADGTKVLGEFTGTAQAEEIDVLTWGLRCFVFSHDDFPCRVFRQARHRPLEHVVA